MPAIRNFLLTARGWSAIKREAAAPREACTAPVKRRAQLQATARVSMLAGMISPPPRKPWYRILYVQVLIAVALGIAVGHWWKEIGAGVQHSGIFGKKFAWPDAKDALQPLGDGF